MKTTVIRPHPWGRPLVHSWNRFIAIVPSSCLSSYSRSCPDFGRLKEPLKARYYSVTMQRFRFTANYCVRNVDCFGAVGGSQYDGFSSKFLSAFYVSDRAVAQIESFNDFTIALSGTNEALILPIFGIFHRSNGLNFGDSIFQGCAYR